MGGSKRRYKNILNTGQQILNNRKKAQGMRPSSLDSSKIGGKK